MSVSEKQELPWWQKYTLTLNEASEYFGIGYKKLKQVKIKFYSEEYQSFYDDYINFVLLYLEYYYPEIEWVGGW